MNSAEHGFATLAFPVIGAGSGGFAETDALAIIDETLRALEPGRSVTVVRFRREGVQTAS